MNDVERRKNAQRAVIAIAVALFAVFIWPTRYSHDRMNLKGMVLPVRIDRFTGRTEVLYPSGWETVSEGSSFSRSKGQAVPVSELSRLTGKASITSIGWLECDIYNSSEWTVPALA